jgi:hypothetical protein
MSFVKQEIMITLEKFFLLFKLNAFFENSPSINGQKTFATTQMQLDQSSQVKLEQMPQFVIIIFVK